MILGYCQIKTFVGKFYSLFRNEILLKTGFGELSTQDLNISFPDCKILTFNSHKYKNEFVDYFGGNRKKFTLQYKLTGTEFQKKVWQAICKIQYGKTVSYKDIAQRIGKPRAARAVGNALNRNRLPIVIPCHRVTRSDGSIGGFHSDDKIKRKLLEFEINNQG